jgi:hypothetical protein
MASHTQQVTTNPWISWSFGYGFVEFCLVWLYWVMLGYTAHWYWAWLIKSEAQKWLKSQCILHRRTFSSANNGKKGPSVQSPSRSRREARWSLGFSVIDRWGPKNTNMGGTVTLRPTFLGRSVTIRVDGQYVHFWFYCHVVGTFLDPILLRVHNSGLNLGGRNVRALWAVHMLHLRTVKHCLALTCGSIIKNWRSFLCAVMT